MSFGGLGVFETILILVVALLIFGPRRLPEIGSSLGKGIREFKRSINEVKHELAEATDVTAPTIAPPSRVAAPVREAPAGVESAVSAEREQQ